MAKPKKPSVVRTVNERFSLGNFCFCITLYELSSSSMACKPCKDSEKSVYGWIGLSVLYFLVIHSNKQLFVYCLDAYETNSLFALASLFPF